MTWRFRAGQILTADLAARYRPVTVYKPAEQSVTSSTTLVDDLHLSATVDANAVYIVELVANVTGATSGDIKLAWTIPSGTSSASRICVGAVTGMTSSGDTTVRMSRADWTDSVAYGAQSLNGTRVMERGRLATGGTAGLLQLQWAQNTSNATASALRAGSYLTVTRAT